MGWLSNMWRRVRGPRELATGEPVELLAQRVARRVQRRCAPLVGVLDTARLQVTVRGKLVEAPDGAIIVAPAKPGDENADWTFCVDALAAPPEEE